jgi:hypothetical protein
MRVLKSLVAVILGLAAGALLSIAADMLFIVLGLLDASGIQHAPPFTVIGILVYRFVFQTIGCYLAARLAPDHPMRHAFALGVTGFLLAIAGAVFLWDAAPPYYNIALVLTALPAAWIGGRWYVSRTSG